MSSEEYLVSRKTALLARLSEPDVNVERTIEQLAKTNQAIGGSSGGGGGGDIDTSLLAREVTLTGINNKLPALNSGAVPVTIAPINLTADWRVLTATTTQITTTIPAGSCYVLITVLIGDVTINGLTKKTDEYINLEPSPFARHPAINLVIPAGKSVEIIRGY